MPRHLLSLLLLLPALSAGCSFGLDGEWTDGQAGRTRWQLADGLCPGLGGGCALDVPLVAGANTALTIETSNRNPATFTASAEGAVATITGTDVENERLYLDLGGVEEGGALVRLFAGGAEPYDQARVQARAAAGLECGWLRADEPVLYTMRALVVSDEATTVRAAGTGDSPSLQLACRVTDEGGRPLLVADAVHWSVAGGTEVATIRSGFELFSTSEADGARIYFDPSAAGVAEVTASIGGLSRTITVTIEE